MKLDPYLRKELINEIRFCANKIAEEADLQRKSYFYSHVYGAVGRVLDFSFDRHLILIDFVLEVSHSTISKRINEIVTEEDKTIPMIKGFFEGLVENLNELATKIEKDEDTYKTLEKIVELTYVTTGDGYYQYTKGQIKL